MLKSFTLFFKIKPQFSHQMKSNRKFTFLQVNLINLSKKILQNKFEKNGFILRIEPSNSKH